MQTKTVFITGGTGYIGRRLIQRLLHNGHHVIALVRPGSENKVPSGCEVVIGNPFDAATFSSRIPNQSTFVQLLGVPHPSPAKKKQFYEIDLRSIQASVMAANQVGVVHFVYVSVSQTPTSIMRDYQQVRAMGEQLLQQSGIPHTLLRPWYVVGPGHWWPLLLTPLYKLMEISSVTRQKALDLGLVSLPQMLRALSWAVENRPKASLIMDVPTIRLFRKTTAQKQLAVDQIV